MMRRCLLCKKFIWGRMNKHFKEAHPVGVKRSTSMLHLADESDDLGDVSIDSVSMEVDGPDQAWTFPVPTSDYNIGVDTASAPDVTVIQEVTPQACYTPEPDSARAYEAPACQPDSGSNSSSYDSSSSSSYDSGSSSSSYDSGSSSSYDSGSSSSSGSGSDSW